MIANWLNWVSAFRAFVVIVNPFQFFAAIVLRRTPQNVRLRTPTGLISLRPRNFESLRTLFSIFCRLDYKTGHETAGLFLDIGSNIGIASAYFLSRHMKNRVCCFEPDPANLETLRRNLQQFGARASLMTCAVGCEVGEVILYRSRDGKYSSLRQSERAALPVVVRCEPFAGILKAAEKEGQPVVVKLDVEGLEVDLVKSVRFEEYPAVSRLLCESTECARWVSRAHRRSLRNGYVEDITFSE